MDIDDDEVLALASQFSEALMLDQDWFEHQYWRAAYEEALS